ncbi:hypothetical protein [Azohydromonas aeria]|uniref:hypothetical protein n=1 Tax=Azohydromonas aeria TaxID=2590212 RepID=UPI0012FC0B19|nr:hypothetical protein [Azohydromonas aeria]
MSTEPGFVTARLVFSDQGPGVTLKMPVATAEQLRKFAADSLRQQREGAEGRLPETLTIWPGMQSWSAAQPAAAKPQKSSPGASPS